MSDHREVSASAGSGREVLCRPVSFFFREFERQGLDPQRLLDGVEHSRTRMGDRHARVDWESFHRLLTNAGREWDDAALIDVGKRITFSRWLYPFAAVARLMYSCRDIYRWNFHPTHGAAIQCFTCLDNVVEEISETRIVIHASMAPGYPPSRELYLICQGSLTAIPALLGLPHAEVQATLTDETACYQVEHPARGGTLAWLRRGITRPFQARTATAELQSLNTQLSTQSDELAESENRFYKAFHAAPTLMVISSVDGRFVDVNEAFERRSGYRRDEVVGRNSGEFGLWRSLETRDDLVQALLRGESLRNVEIEFSNREGENTFCLLAADSITLEGERCLIWQLMDITERKIAEEENRKLQERILHAQKLEGLGVMAGGIAHDFNNLLVGILGNAELALSEMSPAAPERERIESILNASRSAAELTREMLAYAGKAKIESATFDLATLVSQTTVILRSGLPANVEVRYRNSGEPVWVKGDAAKVRQVIMNLVTNAAESYDGRPGTVDVRVESADVDQETLAEAWFEPQFSAGPCARVEVADSSCGMDETTLRRIFDPFYSTKFTGRGLGLAATLGIVKGHGGTLRVRSSPGGGTSFQVLFPPAAQAQAAVEAPVEQHTPRVEGSILIVDDEPAVRDVAKAMLEHSGYRTHTTSCGEDAVELLRDLDTEIVAVLLDLSMPGMGGEATLEALRRIRSDLPVVCCSGHGEQIGGRWAGEHSGVVFVAKPYSLGEIRQQFAELLGANRTN